MIQQHKSEKSVCSVSTQAHSHHLEKNARLRYIKSLSYFTDFSVQMCKQLRGFIEGRVSKDGSMWTFALYAVSEEGRPPKSSETWKIMFLFQDLCLPTISCKYLDVKLVDRKQKSLLTEKISSKIKSKLKRLFSSDLNNKVVNIMHFYLFSKKNRQQKSKSWTGASLSALTLSQSSTSVLSCFTFIIHEEREMRKKTNPVHEPAVILVSLLYLTVIFAAFLSTMRSQIG